MGPPFLCNVSSNITKRCEVVSVVNSFYYNDNCVCFTRIKEGILLLKIQNGSS